MTNTRQGLAIGVVLGTCLTLATNVSAQSGDTFTATASVKTAGGAAASAPITITVNRKTPTAEAETLVKAFVTGGPAALRKALVGVPDTGTIAVGAGAPTPTRITIERPTSGGRLLTIVADSPILFIGGSLPNARPKEGYDFAVVDLQLDAQGAGSGVMAPAARVKALQGAFIVEDYGAEMVTLSDVKKTR